MNPNIKIVGITLALSLFALSTCTAKSAQPVPVSATPKAADIANPASAYCREQGNRSEIRTATDGSQSGVCVFPAGSECDDWAYFRGECAPGSQGKAVEIVRSKLASRLKVQASTIELASVEATANCLLIVEAKIPR